MNRLSCSWAAGALGIMTLCGCSREPGTSAELVVLVTDVSAEESLCTCSPDAPKRYEVLREAMSQALDRPVRFEYMTDFTFDSLPDEQAQQLQRAHLIIGKCTAIEYVSANLGIASTCVGVLTRTNGSPDLSGVWVTRVEDGAGSIVELGGKRISIGPEWQAEKHRDALRQLSAEKVKPGTVTERLLCKEALADVAASEADAAVISDYATGLLTNQEVTDGVSLREIGWTTPRPYIGVFVTDHLRRRDSEALSNFLLRRVAENKALLDALKSKCGFVRPSPGTPAGGLVGKE